MLLGLVRVYIGVILIFGGFIIVAYGLIRGVVLDSLFIEWVVYTTTGGVNIELIFLLDYVRLVFIGVVILVSSIVLVYRRDYIGGDVFFYRFISLVVLFVVSIILIVLRPNFISILLG